MRDMVLEFVALADRRFDPRSVAFFLPVTGNTIDRSDQL
jgi:hypothetical protein